MEEDIKILEERIDYFKCHPEGCNWRLSFEDEKDIKALENLIKGYRELEEDNQKFESGKFLTPAQCVRIGKDYIPKLKIKEKIEELEKYIYKGENAPQDFLQYRIKAKIQVLQELMEG